METTLTQTRQQVMGLDENTVWRLAASATVGHAGYVRAVNSDLGDALHALGYGNDRGWRYWSARAVAVFLTMDRGYGYDCTNEQFAECQRDAAEMFGTEL